VKNAIDKISGVAQASGQSDAHPYEGAGELASALDELMVSIYNTTKYYTPLNEQQ
jgi:hypothetical protein